MRKSKSPEVFQKSSRGFSKILPSFFQKAPQWIFEHLPMHIQASPDILGFFTLNMMEYHIFLLTLPTTSEILQITFMNILYISNANK